MTTKHKVGLHKSNEYLGAHVGTRGLVKLSNMKVDIEDKGLQKICNAWDWMNWPPRAYHMGPVGTGGPRTADESSYLDDMIIGILGRDQQFIKYSNPCLLGYLITTLCPKGLILFIILIIIWGTRVITMKKMLKVYVVVEF
ncbi:hypothetical protein F5H01DRAFT_322958 [Linnemannia elongata]|nr:hypothetical protein F5H01DRAFT_322958 [Linnemannia elongata]